MPTASSSPCSSALAVFFICDGRTCGGSGGICGSVTNSSSTGLSALSALSQAGPTSSGRVTLMPSKPSSRANSAAGTYGTVCVSGFFGSAASTRCS